MKSPLPKVLHRICGTTLLENVLSSAKRIKPDKIIVVTGKHSELIKETLCDSGVFYVVQKEAKGTAHAVLCARPELDNFNGDIMVINGDTPLIGHSTLKRFLERHNKEKNTVSVLSFIADKPGAYGRIIRDGSGRVVSIIEDKDADRTQKGIREVNSGVYALTRDALALLDGIMANSSTGEYYLTDIVSAASRKGMKVGAYALAAEKELMGVNTREELRKASDFMKMEIIRKWTEKGAHFIDENSVFIHPGVSIGKGTLIYPNVFLDGSTAIGAGSRIYPNVRIRNSRIGNFAVIKDSTVIEDSIIKDRATVGPFAHIRPGSEVGREARIGNFVELKKAVIGKKSKASHLSYLGDTVIGNDVNIGAGTITCNYDGTKKHVTTINDGVFVGSDSQLVAPVRVGKGAYIGAGSTITSDVPPHALAVSRTAQKNIEGWAKKRRTKSGCKMKSKKQ